ncbi:hypothetical protein [Paraburkholderia sp. GAS32]|uniref:hypothetical protein n=1 Tax=Paraburkholderia sp. GAS32 TaxID=3035129 RepID=UPI003D259D7D
MSGAVEGEFTCIDLNGISPPLGRWQPDLVTRKVKKYFGRAADRENGTEGYHLRLSGIRPHSANALSNIKITKFQVELHPSEGIARPMQGTLASRFLRWTDGVRFSAALAMNNGQLSALFE